MKKRVSKDLELMLVLKSIPMFNELDFETLYQVSKITSFKNASRNEIVIIKGKPSQSFYILLEGQVGVYLAEGAKEIACIGPCEIFGELGVIDQKERTATVIALENVLMLEFDGAGFLDLLVENAAIAFSVAKTISQRLRSMLEA